MPKTKLPNFIVIGAPKSGTTSLFYYLKQHPDIFLPVRKELHYFSYSELEKQVQGPGDRDVLTNLCQTWEEYSEHYVDVEDQKAIGEISPSYLYFSNVSQKIKNELGDVKILVILRNPIEKAFSQYSHLKRDCREPLSFYDALEAERERSEQGWGDFWLYTQSSQYAKRIQQYYNVFGRKKVKVLLFDDFTFDSTEVVKGIFSFLEVDSSFEVNTGEVYNRSGRSKSKLVSKFFSRPNLLKKMAKAIIPEQIRVTIRLRILDMNTASKEVIDAQSKELLVKTFTKDVKELEALLGRDTGWLQQYTV